MCGALNCIQLTLRVVLKVNLVLEVNRTLFFKDQSTAHCSSFLSSGVGAANNAGECSIILFCILVLVDSTG